MPTSPAVITIATAPPTKAEVQRHRRSNINRGGCYIYASGRHICRHRLHINGLPIAIGIAIRRITRGINGATAQNRQYAERKKQAFRRANRNLSHDVWTLQDHDSSIITAFVTTVVNTLQDWLIFGQGDGYVCRDRPCACHRCKTCLGSELYGTHKGCRYISVLNYMAPTRGAATTSTYNKYLQQVPTTSTYNKSRYGKHILCYFYPMASYTLRARADKLGLHIAPLTERKLLVTRTG